MTRIVRTLLLLLVLPATAYAQDPCATATPPFTVTSGAPFTVMFLMPTSVPVSTTDATLVLIRVDGVRIQIDGGQKLETLALTRVGVCPAGSPFAGQAIYSAKSPIGVAKGAHDVTMIPWNFAVDASGNQVSSSQEGPAVTIPFAAADLIQLGPPPAIRNPIIKK